MSRLIKIIKELSKVLEHLEKLLIKVISILSWVELLLELLK